MKKLIEPQRIKSLMIIFIFLVQITGCVSSRITTSSSDIPVSAKYYYIIHSKTSDYLLENVVISEKILTGKINIEKSSFIGNKIHIYLSTDSAIKINTEMTLSILLDDIAQIKIVEVAKGTTIVVFAVTGIAIIFIIFILVFQGIHITL
jgi:hypothetical protein